MRHLWKGESPARPETNSLRLLPSGPDRVGDGFARTELSMTNIKVEDVNCESPNSLWRSRGESPAGLSLFALTVPDLTGLASGSSTPDFRTGI